MVGSYAKDSDSAVLSASSKADAMSATPVASAGVKPSPDLECFRATLVDPNVSSICSNVLSLDARQSNCIVGILEYAHKLSFHCTPRLLKFDDSRASFFLSTFVFTER